MKKSMFSVICLISLSMAGCASKPLLLVPDYSQRKPQSVVVLPVEYSRSEREQPNVMRNAVAIWIGEALRDRGYTVIGVAQARQSLSEANIPSDEIYSIEAAKICSLLGVDAVLESHLYAYEDSYAVVTRVVKIQMDFLLRDCKSSEILWKQRVDENGPAGWGLDPISNLRRHELGEWVHSAFRSLPKRKK